MPTDEEQNVTEEAHKQSVRSRVAEDSTLDRPYVVMNVLATVVACYGLLSNSTAVVIGAMIIAMLLGPISGVGLALVDGDNQLLRKASTALMGGALLVFITAFIVGFFNREIAATPEMMARTSPNAFDLMIALGGGAAGAYAVISRRLSVAFVGVAIATALVPPLSTASVFLARGEFALSGGALLLAFTNIVAIQFACSVVFFLAGFRNVAQRRMYGRTALMQNSVSMVVLLALGVLFTIHLHSTVAKLLYESDVRKTLRTDLLKYPGAYLADVRFNHSVDSTLVRAMVRGPEPFTPLHVAMMESSLPTSPSHRHTLLRIRYVHTTVMSAKGPLYAAEETGADENAP